MKFSLVIFLVLSFLCFTPEISGKAFGRKLLGGADNVRLRHLVMMGRMVEYFHKKTGYYPMRPEELGDMNRTIISSVKVKGDSNTTPYGVLQKELFDILGEQATLPKDPDDGNTGVVKFYKYKTNGQSYWLSVFLYKKRSFSKMEGTNSHKVTVSSRPNADRYRYSVRFIEHFEKTGKEDSLGMQSSLLNAIKIGNYTWAKELIIAGANVNPTCKGTKPCNPLFIAAEEGSIDKIKFLLKSGANINALNYNYDIPLVTALEKEKFEVVKLFIKLGADLNIPNRAGLTAFLNGVLSGNIDIISLMLENGANINDSYLKNTYTSVKGEVNVSPLEAAVQLQNIELVKLLLDKGADPNINTVKQVDLITYAEALENQEIVDLLKEANK